MSYFHGGKSVWQFQILKFVFRKHGGVLVHELGGLLPQYFYALRACLELFCHIFTVHVLPVADVLQVASRLLPAQVGLLLVRLQPGVRISAELGAARHAARGRAPHRSGESGGRTGTVLSAETELCHRRSPAGRTGCIRIAASPWILPIFGVHGGGCHGGMISLVQPAVLSMCAGRAGSAIHGIVPRDASCTRGRWATTGCALLVRSVLWQTYRPAERGERGSVRGVQIPRIQFRFK